MRAIGSSADRKMPILFFLAFEALIAAQAVQACRRVGRLLRRFENFGGCHRVLKTLSTHLPRGAFLAETHFANPSNLNRLRPAEERSASRYTLSARRKYGENNEVLHIRSGSVHCQHDVGTDSDTYNLCTRLFCVRMGARARD